MSATLKVINNVTIYFEIIVNIINISSFIKTFKSNLVLQINNLARKFPKYIKVIQKKE